MTNLKEPQTLETTQVERVYAQYEPDDEAKRRQRDHVYPKGEGNTRVCRWVRVDA